MFVVETSQINSQFTCGHHIKKETKKIFSNINSVTVNCGGRRRPEAMDNERCSFPCARDEDNCACIYRVVVVFNLNHSRC